MKKLFLTLSLLTITNVSIANTSPSVCIHHTDNEYRELIPGEWSIDTSQKKESVIFYPNGQFVINSELEPSNGTWNIENGKLTINVTQSKWETGSSTSTLLCAGQNIMKIQWAENDIQTLYRY